MNEEKPLLSIGSDGVKINIKEGDLIRINATKTLMRGVQQNVAGGKLEHRATEELTQIGNKMEVSGSGQILNEVNGGSLNQKDNNMRATGKGTIVNRVTGKRITWWILGTIAADLASLYLFGEHIWTKLF